jgi:hypothetical protein
VVLLPIRFSSRRKPAEAPSNGVLLSAARRNARPRNNIGWKPPGFALHQANGIAPPRNRAKSREFALDQIQIRTSIRDSAAARRREHAHDHAHGHKRRVTRGPLSVSGIIRSAAAFYCESAATAASAAFASEVSADRAALVFEARGSAGRPRQSLSPRDHVFRELWHVVHLTRSHFKF